MMVMQCSSMFLQSHTVEKIFQHFQWGLNSAFTKQWRQNLLQLLKFNILNWDFKTYVHYVTRCFIASTRVFNPLTLDFNLSTPAFNRPTRAFSVPTRGFEFVTRGFELITSGFELVTRSSYLVFYFSTATPPFKHVLLHCKQQQNY